MALDDERGKTKGPKQPRSAQGFWKESLNQIGIPEGMHATTKLHKNAKSLGNDK